MICKDCIKRSTLHGSGIIQFCYDHQHANEMRKLLEEFSNAITHQTHDEDKFHAWIVLRDIQRKADKIIYDI